MNASHWMPPNWENNWRCLWLKHAENFLRLQEQSLKSGCAFCVPNKQVLSREWQSHWMIYQEVSCIQNCFMIVGQEAFSYGWTEWEKILEWQMAHIWFFLTQLTNTIVVFNFKLQKTVTLTRRPRKSCQIWLAAARLNCCCDGDADRPKFGAGTQQRVRDQRTTRRPCADHQPYDVWLSIRRVLQKSVRDFWCQQDPQIQKSGADYLTNFTSYLYDLEQAKSSGLQADKVTKTEFWEESVSYNLIISFNLKN